MSRPGRWIHRFASERELVVLRALVGLSIGRAMTIPFIARAGGVGPGDPPKAWLMPLIGDTVVGVAAIAVLIAIWRHPTPATWLFAVTWSAIAAFDALAAFLVDVATPWPQFFVLETFGRPVFFVAAALHAAIISLLLTPKVQGHHGVSCRLRRVPRAATLTD